jgi:hypothetical protein
MQQKTTGRGAAKGARVRVDAGAYLKFADFIRQFADTADPELHVVVRDNELQLRTRYREIGAMALRKR